MKKIILLIVMLLSVINLLAQNPALIESDLMLVGDQSSQGEKAYGRKLWFGTAGDNSFDPIWIARFNVVKDRSELRVSIGDDNNDKLVVGRRFWSESEPAAFSPTLVVNPQGLNSGFVGINQYDPKYHLDVNGTIHAKEVTIDNNGWADFVFDKNYKLRSLYDLERHVNIYKSLPEIPTEAEVKENGIDVGEMQVKLLQKIEELTLYAIQQQKQLDEQSKLIEAQGKLIKELQNKK